MHYWPKILHHAWKDTWEITVGQPFHTIMISGVIFCIMLFCVGVHKGRNFAKDLLLVLIYTTLATVFVGLIILFFEIFFISPSKIYHEQAKQIDTLSGVTNSLFSNITNLSVEKSNLQKKVDADETVIRTVGILTGQTNGTDAENLDEIKTALKKAQDKLFAEKKLAIFRLNETNRVFVFTRTNSGPILFFKLKYAPIKGGVEGFVQSPTGQYPLLDINNFDGNYVGVMVPDLNGLEKCVFTFNYSVDINNTNLFDRVGTNSNGELYFERTEMKNGRVYIYRAVSRVITGSGASSE
jgi:hypothetical protein